MKPRNFVVVGLEVWARFSHYGWSRAVVEKVTPKKIIVAFPYRRSRHWARGEQSGERAWWDLEPRGEFDGRRWEHPQPRKGYSTSSNARLAAMLCGDCQKRPVTTDAGTAETVTPLFPNLE